ncbi:MAG: lysostaphin resistance A-like protein, partial [Fidelibacterota bacterium]
MKLIVNFLFLSALITLSLMAAESLSRKAFPHHLQQWRLWSRHVASSYAVLGRTVGGYLLVAVFWAFEVALYFLATRVLGWWTPSEALFQPDVLATYFPWLSSVAISAQAGFWEESLFRAVPIAGAALLGQKYGNRTAWIVAAFVLQALIFSAAHATYPAQPAYARLVELIIPSVGFGLIYLYFGLLPAIVLHFSMDVVAFALPLFISSAPGNWVNQLLVVLLLFVPLWVVLGARLRTKRWSEPAEEHYNRSWNPPQKERGETRVATTPQMADVGSRTVRIIPLAGLLSLTVWLVTTNFQSDAPPLTAGRQEVQELARHSLSLKGVELPETWKVLNHVEERVDQQHRFVWQEGGKQVYGALMRNYLTPPHWLVRFARFEGDVAERAEEFRVFVGGKKDVFRMSHQLPEAREGPGLLEENARSIAHTTLLGEYHVDPTTLKEVSAVESTLPKRRDWVFTFADTAYYPLEEGEARIVIKITGDKVADSYRYVHVPEDWARAERNRRNTTGIIALSSSAALIIALLAGIVGGIISWSSGSKQARRTPHQGKQFPVPVFVRFLVILFGLSVVNLINGWPAVAARFSTAEPISNQTFSAIGFSLTGSLFLSMGLALIIGFVQTWKNGSPEQRESTHGGISTPIVWGVSLGAMAAAVAALVSAFSPSVTPLWPRYSPAGSYLPLLATGLGPLARYIAYTTLLLLVFAAVNRVSENWRRRKGL